ncbi:MAG: DUF1992 domain-containing protein [Betaproteobacteria bacterium]
MATQDEEIARHLRAALASGELSRAEGFGKPLPEDIGWESTPAELRMAFKILKDAGVAPPEVALFHERARLTAAVRDCPDEARRRELQQQLSELEQKLALRLESLHSRGTL